MRTEKLFRFRYQWCVAVLLLLIVAASPAFGAGNEKTPASAQSIYEAKCVMCHGAGGKGDGWQAKIFWMKTPNWADPAYMQTRSDDTLFRIIKVGGNKGMPAFGLELNGDQMKDLVTYIKAFTKASGPQKPVGSVR